MKSSLLWGDSYTDKTTGLQTAVYAVCFSPDGSLLLSASHKHILIYNANTGEYIKQCRGHTDTVYCLSFSKDGKTFASGGADNNVILWSNTGEGKLRYEHNDSIQCLEFNPVTNQLLSCSCSDFALWSQEKKEVAKTKVTSKILSCSWTSDGQHLALGLFDGFVRIYNRDAVEVANFSRTEPIWCLSFNPSRDEQYDILAVASWDQTLSFYHVSGKQIVKDQKLGFDPCSIAYFSNGEYLCVGGTSGEVSLWNKEGIQLMTISKHKGWVWSVAQKPNQNFIAVGTNSGSVEILKLDFITVHSLYGSLYAFRDSMTDVIVQDLVSDKKITIRCKDYVKKIAIYKDRLAIQLKNRIHILELLQVKTTDNETGEENDEDIQYRITDKIFKDFDCNLMVITYGSLILCQDKEIQMYDFKGNLQRIWELDTSIKYLKVIGGPPFKESLLVGLANGVVLKVFVDNPFPIQLLKHDYSIRCLDLNMTRRKLALVDQNNDLIVYDLKEKKYIYQEKNAEGVAWNSEHENMLCYSGNGVLNIKTENFPVHQHKLQGLVVGFTGSKVFSLHLVSMSTIDIPQSATLFRYVEKADFQEAYKIACLGVTESDWRLLGIQALLGVNLDISRKCFNRIEDTKFIGLIDKYEKLIKQNNFNRDLFVAEIHAYQGRFEEAAKLFVKGNRADLAMDMLCDLRRWKEAKELALAYDNINLTDMIMRQAKFAEEDNDLKAAAELYAAAGEYMRAIQIMGENKWFDSLLETCRSLSPSESKAISLCAEYFKKNKLHEQAKEAFLKIGDYSSLIKLSVDFGKWEEAFEILDKHPEFSSEVYLPYAEHLAVEDKFDEAQEAFRKANKPEKALKIIEELAKNATEECRNQDTSYYFWQLANEVMQIIRKETQVTESVWKNIRKFDNYYRLSQIYFAFDMIHKFSELPFNSVDNRHLFNACIYLYNSLDVTNLPKGISRLTISIALAKLGFALENYKLAREVYQNLQHLRLPKHIADEIDLSSISIHSKPMRNNEECIPICFRCSASNPFINEKGSDCCVNCGHPFIRSPLSYHILPLVEFELEDGIEEEEAIKYIQQAPPSFSILKRADKWRESKNDNVQSLRLDGNDGEDDSDLPINDPFGKALMNLDSKLVKVNREMLKSFKREDVFIVDWNNSIMKRRFYKCIITNFPIVQCKTCNLFFHQDDYEFEVLKHNGKCPFCKTEQK
ncbi:hypothetical protein ABK040_006358 [Willaertia magna]